MNRSPQPLPPSAPTRRLRSRRTVTLAALAALTLAAPLVQAQAQSPSPAADLHVSAKVRSLVARMTLDEKLSFVINTPDPQSVGEAGYVPGVQRLGIPALRLTDSPDGIRINHPATALPAPVALASSFDNGLAESYGEVMGREGRALGTDVLLGPTVNTIRVPQGGRNFEMFSEDPLVSSGMAAGEVTGVQSQGMIATVKHLAENNQETDRQSVNVNVDEQTLHQVELPAFQAAVKAGAGAVMCSYNSVNGSYGCSNDELLNTIVKTQMGFQGWVMSDWGATHSATDITHGLDQDMFNLGSQDNTYFSTDLKAAIQKGTIPESTLDQSVSRILGQMDRFGLLNGASAHRPALNYAAGAKVAQKVAESGAVLLKNAANTLPLSGSTRSVAVIGPSAVTPKITGGGSAGVTPPSAQAPLDTIRERAGKGTKVQYATGIDVAGTPLPSSVLSPAPTFDTAGVTLQPGSSVSYSGTLTVPVAGEYTFSAALPHGYGNVVVDGTTVATSINNTATGSIELSAGPHTLSFRGIPLSGVATTVSLSWSTPAMAATARAQAAALAKTVQTPVVFVSDDLTEGSDRANLSLPNGQDELIEAVAAANPNTVVVLNTGSSVTMPWLSKVKSVLDMYYPGENGAEATARLLYGDVNPSGKLTQTFPADENTTPVSGDPAAYPGVDGQETYSEGIDVGYRWYDKTGDKPLFPFGYGLSYSSFSYSRLAVEHHGSGLRVSFTLRNTGKRAGQEVAQVYVGPSPDVKAQQSVRSLAAYKKVSLRAGESKRVTIDVDAQQLKYWKTSSDSWELGTGTRTVQVGGSSAALPLSARTVIRH